ncbi:MAG: hypothetical protein H0W65_04510 [Sphingomonas sp.]|uniref:hypothetical protein n=1 Tax=Sphingomonas sp. TaxID=28214 RepID=UPI00181B35D3|nr:hypothetical protein [Sphingomonas sp.]MBA3666968.1 hypothetical protein [Sphingomonas sp.]
MNPQPLPDRWIEGAAWLAQAMDLNARLLRLVGMDAERYRASSFLDDRMMKPGMDVRLCDLDAVMADAHALTRDDAGWIFHIGHTGSTLVSRLLGEVDGILAIREPRSLRDLGAVSDSERDAVALTLRRLMARTFAPGQAALVKASSFVSEWAPLLMGPDARALFVFASLPNYIAGILAGENSVIELRALHDDRQRRLRGRGVILDGFDRSDAHRSAAAWACEMSSLEAAAAARPDAAVMWLDFDAMLADMVPALERCAQHLGMAANQERIAAIVDGPLMRRYSKSLEYDYSPSLRAELLAEATRDHRGDIERAVSALHAVAADAPLIARALGRVQGRG